ncbi:MAG: dihydroorotate dehydrogenase [Treponemataceae bacterium]
MNNTNAPASCPDRDSPASPGIGTGAAKGPAPDLSVVIAGVRFANPVFAASGTFGYGREYEGLLDIARLGGICTKGLTLEPRAGNKGIRLHETPSGLINSIGLENPGIEVFIEKELPRLSKLGPVVIANLSGSSIETYEKGARLLVEKRAAAVDMIELNISCPNVKAGGMAFGLCAPDAAAVVSAVRKACGNKPLMVKLSPNAGDLCAVAKACEDAGADALSLVNTFKAIAIDIERSRPVFANISAGLSGPAIRPIALRMVWEVCDAVKIPVVGLGGIATASDAIEFLMAGATAIQVGASTFSRPTTMTEIIDGISAFMARKNIARVENLIGAAKRSLNTNTK